jgi:hypothetical protein
MTVIDIVNPTTGKAIRVPDIQRDILACQAYYLPQFAASASRLGSVL